MRSHCCLSSCLWPRPSTTCLIHTQITESQQSLYYTHHPSRKHRWMNNSWFIHLHICYSICSQEEEGKWRRVTLKWSNKTDLQIRGYTCLILVTDSLRNPFSAKSCTFQRSLTCVNGQTTKAFTCNYSATRPRSPKEDQGVSALPWASGTGCSPLL